MKESQGQGPSLQHLWPPHMPVVSQEAMAMAASGAHPNVVRYYSAWTERQAEGQYFYILMEKCEVSLGTKHLLDGQPFREDELLDILRQVWTSAECRAGIRASTAFMLLDGSSAAAAPLARLCFGYQASDTHRLCLCAFEQARCP